MVLGSKGALGVTNPSVQNMPDEYDGWARGGNMFTYKIVFTDELFSDNDIPLNLFLTNLKDKDLIRIPLGNIIKYEGDRT